MSNRIFNSIFRTNSLTLVDANTLIIGANTNNAVTIRGTGFTVADGTLIAGTINKIDVAKGDSPNGIYDDFSISAANFWNAIVDFKGGTPDTLNNLLENARHIFDGNSGANTYAGSANENILRGGDMRVEKLRRHQLRSAKRAFTTRRVPLQSMVTIISGDIRPKAGDLVLAKVSELGKHRRIELINGRRARIFLDDTIIVAYGNRYAPDQFEALVGNDLCGCDLVAGGGVASREVCRHERMPEPTRIQPIGLIGDAEGRPINLMDHRIEFPGGDSQIPVVFVTGTAMNSGKTMTSGSLVRGLRKAGLKVAGIKATGTGSGGDLWFMSDMGANRVLDFTDAGFASTYKAEPEAILEGVLGLIGHAEKSKCDIAVVEIADGLKHEETSLLLHDPRLLESCVGMVFAAGDSLGAVAGVGTLTELGYKVFALSGQITRSPLASREARTALDLPVLTPFEIQEGVLNEDILNAGRLKRRSDKSLSTRDTNIIIEIGNGKAESVRDRAVRPTSSAWQPAAGNVIRSHSDTDVQINQWLEGRNPGGGLEATSSNDLAPYARADVSESE